MAVIGILMLIGIVKKNAIMMIDVALTLQREGMAPAEAIYRACILRFRPIMMTTFAAIMGALPIALGDGASAELRQPLGIAVVGGLVRVAGADAVHHAGASISTWSSCRQACAACSASPWHTPPNSRQEPSGTPSLSSVRRVFLRHR